MRLHKLAALFLLGSVSLCAQTAATPKTTDKKAPAATSQAKGDQKKTDQKTAHKGCPCAHAKDGKSECHCKEMMAGKDADHGEMCNHGKAENMSKANKDDKMAKAGCCGCCGGKCDRMKHKLEHDKSTAPKAGM